MTEYEQIFKQIECIAEKIPCAVYWLDLNFKAVGVNQKQLQAMGESGLTKEEVIGKTVYELFPEDIAKRLQKDFDEISKFGYDLEREHSVEDITTGRTRYFAVTISPIKNESGIIIGIIGTAIEITQKKEADIVRSSEQERFRKIVERVAHDIRAPIASTLAIAKAAIMLPEDMRITLVSAANRINDLANGLLHHFNRKAVIDGVDKKSLFLISAAINEILSEKRVQHNQSSVIFEASVSPGSHFAFINTELCGFKRALSNLINNAVDALEQKHGRIIVELKLISEDNLVKVSIRDNGKGIPPELVEKIRNNISFTDKKDGHGIGLSQVREMLERNSGNFAINSIVGVGTEIILTFPAMQVPKWIATHIKLQVGDILVILDDDSSIHGAWDAILANYASDITLVKHFNLGNHAIEYVNSLTKDQKSKVFLLVDYELLGQGINGLDVVEHTGITRSILVTSHHENNDVQKRAKKTKTKILPKLLVSEISISIAGRDG